MNMLLWLKKIYKPDYDTLNRIEIIASNLEDNFCYLSSLQPHSLIIPVLKSNAYGHGLAPICQILKRIKAPMIAVDSFPEAQIARRYFPGRILILGEMPARAYHYARSKRLEFCVYNPSTLATIAADCPGAAIHLFSNTGMNREGIQDMEQFLDANKEAISRLQVRGLCSHLAAAEEENSLLTKHQVDKFFKDLEVLKAKGFSPDTVHLGNSAGIFTLSDSRLSAFRAGIAFYGYSPFDAGHLQASRADKLKPALRLISKVVSIQKVKAGDPVSYNATFVVSGSGEVALIPFGYYEGLNRALSNQAIFKVRRNGQPIKVAGRICMNLCCLDASGQGIVPGEEIEVISAQPEASNSIVNLSKISKNIPYESLVALRDNIRREVLWE